MTDLSPVAKAVLNAVTLTRYDVPYQACPKSFDQMKADAAAVLWAVANQASNFEVPFDVVDDWEKIKGSCASFYAAAEWGYKQALKHQLVIADELKNAQLTTENDL